MPAQERDILSLIDLFPLSRAQATNLLARHNNDVARAIESHCNAQASQAQATMGTRERKANELVELLSITLTKARALLVDNGDDPDRAVDQYFREQGAKGGGNGGAASFSAAPTQPAAPAAPASTSLSGTRRPLAATAPSAQDSSAAKRPHMAGAAYFPPPRTGCIYDDPDDWDSEESCPCANCRDDRVVLGSLLSSAARHYSGGSFYDDNDEDMDDDDGAASFRSEDSWEADFEAPAANGGQGTKDGRSVTPPPAEDPHVVAAQLGRQLHPTVMDAANAKLKKTFTKRGHPVPRQLVSAVGVGTRGTGGLTLGRLCLYSDTGVKEVLPRYQSRYSKAHRQPLFIAQGSEEDVLEGPDKEHTYQGKSKKNKSTKPKPLACIVAGGRDMFEEAFRLVHTYSGGDTLDKYRLADKLLWGLPDSARTFTQVPIRVGSGWVLRQPLPKLAVHKKWLFDTYTPSLTNTVSYFNSAHRSGVKAKVVTHQNRDYYQFEWFMADPESYIAGALHRHVLLPFETAEWGVSVGRVNQEGVKPWGLSKFQLPNNRDDPEADLPPHWAKEENKRLRTEQLRALHWMQQREMCDELFDVDYHIRMVPPFRADVKLGWRARGGVLADHIGYGKTATLLGLLDAHSSTSLKNAPNHPFNMTAEEKATLFDLSKTTLIIAPSHLLDQWYGEIQKFLKDAKLRVLVVKNVTPLSMRSVKELQKYDVILTTFRLLYSQVYQNRLREISGAPQSAINQHYTRIKNHMRTYLRDGPKAFPRWHKDSAALRKTKRKEVKGKDDLIFPLLQQCFFRRVVLDEFHEAEAQDTAQICSLVALNGRARWGLTGTPNIQNCGKVAAMARLLHVDLGLHNGGMKSWINTEGLKCQRFISTFIRQNAENTAIDSIETVNHKVNVTLSSAERALYLQQRAEVNNDTVDELRRRERLVMLCSHFNTRANTQIRSAEEETQNVLKKLRTGFEKSMQTLRRRCLPCLELQRRRMKPSALAPYQAFAIDPPAQANGNTPPVPDWFTAPMQSALHQMKAAACDELQSCFTLLRDTQLVKLPKKPSFELAKEVSDHVVKIELMEEEPKNPERFWLAASLSGELLASLNRHVEDQFKQVIENHRRFYYFQNCLKAFESTDAEEQECAVCMGTKAEGLMRWSILPCGHIYCSGCVASLNLTCAQCREPFKAQEIFDVSSQTRDLKDLKKEVDFQEEEAFEVRGKARTTSTDDKDAEKGKQTGDDGEANGDEEEGDDAAANDDKMGKKEKAPKPTKKWSKFGTKIQTICETLRQIKVDDPKAKVIVFCQWKSLQDKVAESFAEYNFRFSAIQGSVYQRNRVLASFQNDAASEFGESPEILLLNLEVAASGANCTAASYVFLVHPFNAPDVDKAISYELQAIGRVRRLGQMRKQIHIYRFVTEATVEEDMTREHEEGIARRKNAPANGALSPSGGNSPRQDKDDNMGLTFDTVMSQGQHGDDDDDDDDADV